jgi:hypothetical protein
MKSIQLLIPRISNSIHKKITRKQLKLNLISTTMLVFGVFVFAFQDIFFLNLNFFCLNFFCYVFILF